MTYTDEQFEDAIIALAAMVGQYASDERMGDKLRPERNGCYVSHASMQAGENAEAVLMEHGIVNARGMFVVDWFSDDAIRAHLRKRRQEFAGPIPEPGGSTVDLSYIGRYGSIVNDIRQISDAKKL